MRGCNGWQAPRRLRQGFVGELDEEQDLILNAVALSAVLQVDELLGRDCMSIS